MPTTTPPAGVPLNVWVLPAPTDQPAHTPSTARRALAGIVLDAYTEPAAVVADLTPGHGEAAAAAIAAGRTALTINPDSPSGSIDELAGTVDLAIALPPGRALLGHGTAPITKVAAQSHAETALPLLRAGGVLVIGGIGLRPGHDSLGRTVAIAEHAGYGYLQHHVVILRPPVQGESGHRSADHLDLLAFRSSR